MDNNRQLYSLPVIKSTFVRANLFKRLLFLVLFTIPLLCLSQTTPFARGVNLTEWFQTSGPGQIQFTKFTRQDFVNIKSLGCDVIRLPINLHNMTNGEPDYIFDPLFLMFLDSAVSWAEELEIYLILDDHSYAFTPVITDHASFEILLIKVWTQIAQRYTNSSEYIIYEIKNEPHDISHVIWGDIQGNIIETIREIDTAHYIVVGPAEWNSYNYLAELPEYSDDKLIYTFHFYDPFLFTHQGADWTDVSMVSVKGIPFPYLADSMPDSPPEVQGTWVETLYGIYPNEGTGEQIRQWLDVALEFRNFRSVPIYCGELGVYNLNVSHSDRIGWYDTVITYLEENLVAWSMWDYTGGFGLFESGGNDLFEYDLDTSLLKALGFTIPPQLEYHLQPDTVGFPIYTDFIEEKVSEASYGNGGELDFYNTNHPNNNMYCIYWSGADQYSVIGFDFKPDKDLQFLVDHNYALDMMIRGSSPGKNLDIRFLDTKTDEPGDHPWRVRYTIDESLVAWDGSWQHINIPLSEFTEHGSWDSTWYNPVGEYDWRAVDRFEIVTEYQSLEESHYWFDNIYVTNLDTAQIWDNTILKIPQKIKERPPSLQAFPNPSTKHFLIMYSVQKAGNIEIEIVDMNGKLIQILASGYRNEGEYSLRWDGTDNKCRKVNKGLYICRYSCNEDFRTIKLLVL